MFCFGFYCCCCFTLDKPNINSLHLYSNKAPFVLHIELFCLTQFDRVQNVMMEQSLVCTPCMNPTAYVIV